MLLRILKGKFTMGKLKSSRFVIKFRSISRYKSRGAFNIVAARLSYVEKSY